MGNISTLNVKNYNTRMNSPSVHVYRQNVANRYNFQASYKANAYLATAQPDFVVAQFQPEQCHMSGLGKWLTGIKSFFTGFGASSSIASGNMNPMNAMAQMGGGMPMMGGCGMFGAGMSNYMSMQGSLFGNRFMG